MKEKKNKQSRAWVYSKRKKGEVYDILCRSPWICMLSRVCIRAKFPQSHKEMLTHLLTLANTSSQSTGSNSNLSRASASLDFCRLPCSLDWSVKSTTLDWLLLNSSGTFLPSSSSLWEISRRLCGFRAKIDKGIFWLALIHTYRYECLTSCHNTWVRVRVTSSKYRVI